ncbi:hypothetical protein MKW98_003350 [Papaver atlanticum]|uniref:Large ribosomal subunit protein uL10-like insertion domain-containing protein n=1 Tax=Papaver atlanticum TaxID=357466 RepID=A0AAD4TAW9_9MAGN|nr:hypothetical protein MKW98_003350 [Papaver atlanticum]
MQNLKAPSTRNSSNLSPTTIHKRFILDVKKLYQRLLELSQKQNSILNSNLETVDIKLKNCDLVSIKLEVYMLQNYDDAAVLLTDKTKDEVLRKFKEYNECDFVKTGQTPMAPLVFAKDEVLPLPPRSSAMNLCPKLKELGMPVELSGGCIKLTETFSVCEDGVRVTEDATKILCISSYNLLFDVWHYAAGVPPLEKQNICKWTCLPVSKLGISTSWFAVK